MNYQNLINKFLYYQLQLENKKFYFKLWNLFLHIINTINTNTYTQNYGIQKLKYINFSKTT